MKAQKVYFNEEIDKIVLKRRVDRTKQDNEKLSFAFQSFPFFLNIIDKHAESGDLMVETIIKSLRFFELSKGTPLFRHGEVISSMFIVCKGQINLYKPPLRIKLRQPDPKANRYERFKAIFGKYLVYSVDKELEYMYGEGQAIGEKDILSGRKRPSLCEAWTNCIIAELTSTDYLSIFERTESLEKNSILSLLSSLPFFIKGKNALTERIQNVLTKRRYKKGQMVYRQGDRFDAFYIIRKGSFQISMKSSVKFFSTIDMYCFFELYKDLYERFSSLRVFELKNEYEEMKEYRLINKGSGEFLGHFELKLQTERYLFSAQCISDKSELFVIPKNVFEGILTPFCKQILMEETSNEMNFFQKRIKDIRDVGRARGKGNKYKATILQKIHMKEEQINTEARLKSEKEAVCRSPIASINKTRVASSIANKRLFINRNRKFPNRDSDYIPDLTLHFQGNSFATCDSNTRNLSRKPKKPNETTYPTNLMIKRALKQTENQFFRPQTSTINKYTDFYQKRPETSATQESSDTISGRYRLFNESNKKAFPKCLEVNKEFALNNNKNIDAHKVYQLFSYKKK